MKLYEKNGNILYILNILKKYSNSDHILSTSKIQSKIEEIYGVTIDTRTIRRNIILLIEKFGYDIGTYQENHKGYYYTPNSLTDFELGELSAIINTFAYSNFMPDKMSDKIIKKCINMLNVYEMDKYNNYKVSMKNTKTDNLEIIKNIEDINDAIFNKKKISFDYFKYKVDDNNTLIESKINGNNPYKVSPYKLVYALQKFYLVCLKDGNKDMLTYRLDRMKNITILKEKINSKFDENEIDFFIKSNVNMLNDDNEKVEIECKMEILDNVIELYGKDIKLEKIDENTFKASFYTSVKGFKYWCMRNIETVKVISPQKLKKDIIKVIKENAK